MKVDIKDTKSIPFPRTWQWRHHDH